MSVSALRSELLKARLDRFTRMLHGVEHGELRSVHRARVSSRHLRELVPVLQLDSDVSKRLGRRLRRVTGHLGAVRELDVLLLLIDELNQSRPHHGRALQLVGAAVSKSRDNARKRLLDNLPVGRMWRLAHKLERVIDGLRAVEETSLSRPVISAKALRWAVDARVALRAGRLRSAIRSAGAVYLPERLHAVRIALKKLRYALELSTDVTTHKKTAAPNLRALKRGQDVLGRMHDLQLLIERVRDVQASLVLPNISLWRELDGLVIALEDDCRRLHARYVRERPALTSITNRLAARLPVSMQGRRAG